MRIVNYTHVFICLIGIILNVAPQYESIMMDLTIYRNSPEEFYRTYEATLIEEIFGIIFFNLIISLPFLLYALLFAEKSTQQKLIVGIGLLILHILPYALLGSFFEGQAALGFFWVIPLEFILVIVATIVFKKLLK